MLVGDGDEVAAPDLAHEIVGGITGSRLLVVAYCGHLCIIERPAAVNAALGDWLGA